MSKQDKAGPDQAPAEIKAAEGNLGQVLALIHRILPRLDEPARFAEVQAVLRRAAVCIEAARSAHEKDFSPSQPAAGPQRVATRIAPEIAAVIAAAVAVTVDTSYRLISVQQIQTPVPYVNVWALEGRTQIFQSHRLR
jgi:hypothetical protein